MIPKSHNRTEWTRRRFLGTTGAGLAGLWLPGLTPRAAAQGIGLRDAADTNLFDDTSVLDLDITFNDANWQSVIDDVTYLEATLTHSGVQYPSVGVRYKGNSSLNYPGDKKPFKVDVNKFNDDQEFFGLTKFVLNNSFKDPTMMRERLAYTMFAAMGVPCPRTNFCRLTIGGVYWGLYIFVETVNKVMTTRFWEDLDGNRFEGETGADLVWYGSSQATYETRYQLDSNEAANDWTDLINFINVLNNTAPASLQSELEPIFDVDGFLRFLALNTLLGNLDSYQGSGHNYYLLDTDPSIMRFAHIPWDLNEAFGNFTMGMSVTEMRTMSLTYTGGTRPLITQILSITDWSDLFHYRIQQTLDTVFSYSWVDAEVTRYHALIDQAVQDDTNKFNTYAQYVTNQTDDVNLGGGPGGGWVAGLRDFTLDRAAFARGEVGDTPVASPDTIADHLTGTQELTGLQHTIHDRDSDGTITVADLVRAVNGD